ncbi:hypothetical protein PROFUN_14588, partial [Planoprotostelium fungivorum]
MAPDASSVAIYPTFSLEKYPAEPHTESLRFYNPRCFYNDSKSLLTRASNMVRDSEEFLTILTDGNGNDYVCRNYKRPTKLQAGSFSQARSKQENVEARNNGESMEEKFELELTGLGWARDEDGWITDLLIDSRLEALRQLDLQGTILKAANSLGNVGPSHQHTGQSIREWLKQDQFVLCPFNFEFHWILVVLVPGPSARAYLLDSKTEKPKGGRYASLIQSLTDGGIKEKNIIRPFDDRETIQEDNFSCGVYTMWFIELLLSRKDRQLHKAGVEKWMKEIYREVRNGDLTNKRQELIKKLDEDLNRKKDILKEREQRNEGKQEDNQEVNEMERSNGEKAEKVVGVEPEGDSVLDCLTKDNAGKMNINGEFLSSEEMYIPSLRELKMAAQMMDKILSQGIEDIKKNKFKTAAAIFGSINDTRERIRRGQCTLEQLGEMLKGFCQLSALVQLSTNVKQRTAIMILIYYIELRGEIDIPFTWPGHMLHQIHNVRDNKTQTMYFARAVAICYIAKDSSIEDKLRYIYHLFERQAVIKSLRNCKAILHLRGKSSKQGVHPIHVIWRAAMDKYLSICEEIEDRKTDMWKQIQPRVSELDGMSQPEVVTQIVEMYVYGEKNKQRGLKQSKLSAEAIGEKEATHDDGVDEEEKEEEDEERKKRRKRVDDGEKEEEERKKRVLDEEEEEEKEEEEEEKEEEEEEKEEEEEEEKEKERRKRRKRAVDDDEKEEEEDRKRRKRDDDSKEEDKKRKTKKSVRQRKDGKKRRTIKKSAASKRDQETESEVEEDLVERVSSLDEANEVSHLSSSELRVEDTWKYNPRGKLFHSRMFDVLTPKAPREQQDCEEEVLVREMNNELKPFGLVLRGEAGTLREITEALPSPESDRIATADFQKDHEDEDSLEYLEAYAVARELRVTLVIHELYGGEHHTAILRGGEPNKKILRVAHLRSARDEYYRVVEEGEIPMLEHAKTVHEEVTGEWLVENISDQQRPALVE